MSKFTKCITDLRMHLLYPKRTSAETEYIFTEKYLTVATSPVLCTKDNFSKDSKEDIGDITAESTGICAMARKMDVTEQKKVTVKEKQSLFSDYIIKIKPVVRKIQN